MKLKYRQIPNALFALTLAILFIPSCSLMKAGPPPDALTGNWEGSITITDGTVIRIYMEFFKDADGDYQAFMKVPQQTDETILINDIVLVNQTLTFSVEMAKAVFVGKVESKNKFTGEVIQEGDMMPVEFKRTQ